MKIQYQEQLSKQDKFSHSQRFEFLDGASRFQIGLFEKYKQEGKDQTLPLRIREARQYFIDNDFRYTDILEAQVTSKVPLLFSRDYRDNRDYLSYEQYTQLTNQELNEFERQTLLQDFMRQPSVLWSELNEILTRACKLYIIQALVKPVEPFRALALLEAIGGLYDNSTIPTLYRQSVENVSYEVATMIEWMKTKFADVDRRYKQQPGLTTVESKYARGIKRTRGGERQDEQDDDEDDEDDDDDEIEEIELDPETKKQRTKMRIAREFMRRLGQLVAK